MSSRKTLTESKLDQLFSLLIREAYDYICQNPSCEFCENHSLRYCGGLDNSHYYGRRYRGGRWFPDNCKPLCRPFHGYLDKHHSEHVDFMRRHLGPVRHAELVTRMQGTFKYSPQERWEIGQHYRAEHKRIQQMRMDGVTGVIEVQAYD